MLGHTRGPIILPSSVCAQGQAHCFEPFPSLGASWARALPSIVFERNVICFHRCPHHSQVIKFVYSVKSLRHVQSMSLPGPNTEGWNERKNCLLSPPGLRSAALQGNCCCQQSCSSCKSLTCSAAMKTPSQGNLPEGLGHPFMAQCPFVPGLPLESRSPEEFTGDGRSQTCKQHCATLQIALAIYVFIDFCYLV